MKSNSSPDAPAGKVPKLETLIRERQMNYTVLANEVSCSRETIRKACLPFGNKGRSVPREVLLRRIVARFPGELSPADFYAPLEVAA